MANSNNQSQTFVDSNYVGQKQDQNISNQQTEENNQDANVVSEQTYDEQSYQYNNKPTFKQYDNLYQQYNQSYLQTGEYFPKKRPIFRWEQEYLKNDSMNFEDSEFYNLLHFDQIQNQVSSSNNDDFSDLVEETSN